MIITESGIAIRLAVKGMRVMGRNTQGVKLINLREGDQIAAATQVPSNEDNDDQEVENTEDSEEDSPEGTKED